MAVSVAASISDATLNDRCSSLRELSYVIEQGLNAQKILYIQVTERMTHNALRLLRQLDESGLMKGTSS